MVHVPYWKSERSLLRSIESFVGKTATTCAGHANADKRIKKETGSEQMHVLASMFLCHYTYLLCMSKTDGTSVVAPWLARTLYAERKEDPAKLQGSG